MMFIFDAVMQIEINKAKIGFWLLANFQIE